MIRVISDAIVDLLIIQAEAGVEVNLARASIAATPEQIEKLLRAVKSPGFITLCRKAYSTEEQVFFTLLGGRWIDEK